MKRWGGISSKSLSCKFVKAALTYVSFITSNNFPVQECQTICVLFACLKNVAQVSPQIFTSLPLNTSMLDWLLIRACLEIQALRNTKDTAFKQMTSWVAKCSLVRHTSKLFPLIYRNEAQKDLWIPKCLPPHVFQHCACWQMFIKSLLSPTPVL